MKLHLVDLKHHQVKPEFKAALQRFAVFEDPFWRSCFRFKHALMSSKAAGLPEGL